MPASALPGANPAAPISHVTAGTSNPGTDFGLTVVTIGDQGISGPCSSSTFTSTGRTGRSACARSATSTRCGVKSQGRKDITGPGDSDVKPSTIGPITTDLTPPGPGAANGPQRDHFWSKSITEAHEQAHVDRFYTDPAFWPAAIGALRGDRRGHVGRLDPANKAAASIAGVKKANTPPSRPRSRPSTGRPTPPRSAAANPPRTASATRCTRPCWRTIRDTVVPPKPTGATATHRPGRHGDGHVDGDDRQRDRVRRRAPGRGDRGVHERRHRHGGDRTFTDTTPAAGTKATYRVRAQGVKGNSAPSNNQTVTTTP